MSDYPYRKFKFTISTVTEYEYVMNSDFDASKLSDSMSDDDRFMVFISDPTAIVSIDYARRSESVRYDGEVEQWNG